MLNNCETKRDMIKLICYKLYHQIPNKKHMKIYISACDNGNLLDIFEDREMYKTCNKFYREFGKLVFDFYNETLMPDLHKITKENTVW